MPINSHIPNNTCPVLRVCGLIVRGATSLTVAQDVVRISTSGVCVCVLMSLGKENGLLTFILIFFQSNCDTYLWTKEKTKSCQILQFHTNTLSKNTSLQLLALPLCRLQGIGLVMLPSRKIMSVTALGQENIDSSVSYERPVLIFQNLILKTASIAGFNAQVSAQLTHQARHPLCI